jgi:hypothetical protein
MQDNGSIDFRKGRDQEVDRGDPVVAMRRQHRLSL